MNAVNIMADAFWASARDFAVDETRFENLCHFFLSVRIVSVKDMMENDFLEGREFKWEKSVRFGELVKVSGTLGL